MDKQKMYVSLTDFTCSHMKGTGSNEITVEMPPAFAKVLMKLFRQLHQLEDHNMFRAHLPYIPYHYDALNHDIDYRLQKVYALIHEFGDAHTKRFVEQLPYFRTV